jgi:hypothetical protein
MDRSRRGGSGVDAEWGRLRRPWGEGPGDWATPRGRRTTQGVPTPPNPSPAPTGMEVLPGRHDKKPTRVRSLVVALLGQ